MKKISISAVIVGAILGIVAASVLAIPLTIYEVKHWHLLGLPADQGQEAVKAAYGADISWQLMGLAIDGFCNIFAGYTAGKIARHNEMLNGSLTCILGLLFSLAASLRGKLMTPAWIQVTSFFLAPALGALGGYISARRNAPARY
jgi:hypothetical protein